MALIADRAARTSRQGLALTLAAATLGLLVPMGAQANQAAGSGWIAIPTRVDELKVRYRSLGCKDSICAIEVQGLTGDEAISKESIDCKAMKIRNATSPVTTGWKTIAPGTVDMDMAHKVCHSSSSH
jgi:hypothetical protein